MVHPARISLRAFHTAASTACGEAQMNTQWCLCLSLYQTWTSSRNVWALPVVNGSVHFNSPAYARTASPVGRFSAADSLRATAKADVPGSWLLPLRTAVA